MAKNFCVRCTHLFEFEVRYLLLGEYYCKACMIAIEHDHDYIQKVRELASLRQIEN